MNTLRPSLPNRRGLPSLALLAASALGAACGEAARPVDPWTFTPLPASAFQPKPFVPTFGDDAFSFILEDTGAGAAWIDADGDRRLDLYLLNGCFLAGVSDPKFAAAHGSARNVLLRNCGDGTWQDITESAGVGDPGYGMSALVGDIDGDGDEDLYVLNHGPNVLYRNRGDGTFFDDTERALLAGPATSNGQPTWSVNGFFFDLDQDRDLDLYVANYLAFDPTFVDPNLPEEYPYPGPESYAGQASRLYLNDGTGTFTDVTEARGVLQENGKTMGAAFGDFDGDGRLDLVEAVDSSGNFLFLAQADGTFRECAAERGFAFDSAGNPMASMHCCVADADGDLDLDIFVPNLARGCLYRNDGSGHFVDVSDAAGIGAVLDGSGAWGGSFGDFDNDGVIDLLVVLGGAFNLNAKESDRLFRGLGDGRFEDVSAELGGYFAQADVSRGAAFADFDDDGDLDFAVNVKDVGAPAVIVRNDLPAGNHWLKLELRGTRSNAEGIGAKVLLTAGGKTQLRVVGRADSYMSSSDVRVHFGLGAATRIDHLVVHWPSGTTQEVAVTAVDRTLEIVEIDR